MSATQRVELLWPSDEDECKAKRETWTGNWVCELGCRSQHACKARQASQQRLEDLRKNNDSPTHLKGDSCK